MAERRKFAGKKEAQRRHGLSPTAVGKPRESGGTSDRKTIRLSGSAKTVSRSTKAASGVAKTASRTASARARKQQQAARRSRDPRNRNSKRRHRVSKQDLVRALEQILEPQDRRWADEIAAVMTVTVSELSKHRSSLKRDPKARRELKDAHRKLDAFYQFWKSRPHIHEYVPRETHQQSVSITASVAALLRQIDGAITRLLPDGESDGRDEIARRWLGFAVISMLRAHQIQVSRFEGGVAVRILELACELAGLRSVTRSSLPQYLRSGSEWLGKVKR